MSLKGRKRTIDQFLNLFILPEIKRRQKEGKIPKPFQLWAAQFLSSFRGIEIYLNEEVKGLLAVETITPVKEGQRISITDKNIEKIYGFKLPKEDRHKGHSTALWIAPNRGLFTWEAKLSSPRNKLEDVLNSALKKEMRVIKESFKDKTIKYKDPEEQDRIQDVLIHTIEVYDNQYFKTGGIKYPTTYLRRTADRIGQKIKKREEKHHDLFRLESDFQREGKEGEEYNKFETIASDDIDVEALIIQLENEKLIESLIDVLSEKEKEVYKLTWKNVQTLTQEEIAQKLGITRQMVSRYQTKIIEKLKRGVEEHSYFFLD